MNFISKITVVPKLPENISGLKELSENMWWTWNYDAQNLFEKIDENLWNSTKRNPVLFLKKVEQKNLNKAANDPEFYDLYLKVMEKFHNYMNENENNWFRKTHSKFNYGEIAYFCMEYGIHESFPMYSGGLGILAGDHIKSASDLGIPLIAVGLLYRKGYFQQKINAEGWQESIYFDYDFSDFPIFPAKNDKGEEIYVDLNLLGRKVYAKVWEMNVGRVKLYLLDTDLKQNDPEDREITSTLYGGDLEMRIKQEILIGIGGVRAIRKLGYSPSVWHMNEGHAAFLGLEKIRELVQEQSLTFKEAIESVKAGSVFTTHTPVPAGNDVFPISLIDKYFGDFWPELKAARQEFIELGLEKRENGEELFSMTILALKLSGRANGVSKLHGIVSRKLWNHVWPGIEWLEVPINYVTNGVHINTWLNPLLQDFLKKYLGENWMSYIDDPELWNKISEIPDNELWNMHLKLKKQLIDFIHRSIKEQRMRHGETVEQLQEVENIGDEKALTIGFARRFATYKRADLIFKDVERLKKILNDPNKPVQIIFAGKAHPADKSGQEIIKKIYEYSRKPEFHNKIIILENYDIEMARYLVSGVDIWLNNPRRPHEASGTSGQKSGMNGAINFSVLDGWWVEGYNAKNGWAIGDNRDYEDHELQDRIDSVSIYNQLEKQIIPLYYKKDHVDFSKEWVEKMKESIKSVTSFFNTSRMLKEYTQKFYMPALEQYKKFSSENFKIAKEFARWVKLLKENWNSIKIHVIYGNDLSGILNAEEEISMRAEIYLPGIGPDSILPEIVVAKLDNGKTVEIKTYDMKLEKEIQKDTYLYTGKFIIEDRGEYGINVRVSPNHPFMPHKNYLMGMVKYPE
ncbi:alpha-glucan family phosphorylase [Petrotoga sp. 9PWA.NaAc.5.4]|uniref:alpha-glucan family phosphorylase n=1 Tax=Petrotoga sp. 9PWA.NaAc.5.4 TaxID=1434328 RepID=UPI000CAF644F|nr:alpha-glucan family phosphorylase [Petrotoga sp. 9PWA.NaAc.5.4]PNR95775.1 alpha-glucan phosphorylase [Petrotoga sp. 9PWA.NaAc.5.4]